MAWITVNSHGYGSIFENKPVYEQSDLWSNPSLPWVSRYGVHLSVESIKRLVGREISFKESPFFIK